MSSSSPPVRTALIAGFTVVETAALAGWLSFVRDAPTVSVAVAIGLGVLLVGLVVEHVLTDFAVNGVALSLPRAEVVVFSASETALWAVWLVVAERLGGAVGVLVAGVVLAVLLVPQHTIEDNVLRGRGLLADLADLGTAGFSLVEAVAATLWLAFVLRLAVVEPVLVGQLGAVGADVVGLAALAALLFVEHTMGVRFSSRD